MQTTQIHQLPTVSHILYLHGFRSSPQSAKAQMVAAAVAQAQARHPDHAPAWACPQLPPSPAQAWREIQAIAAEWPTESTAVIGSSLGGFYAAALANARGCRAALINPAINPARDGIRHIGEQSHFHSPEDRFYFRPEFIDELKAITPWPLNMPERHWSLIAQGDEVLDWREMQAACNGTVGLLLPGSDHAVSDFDQHLPALLAWLNLG
jgi:predicted esterase YcpF (UPF0227 family)